MKKPLPEYPRPQLQRDSFLNLNGYWDFCVTKGEEPDFKEKILVPYSPETKISEIERKILPDDVMWYQTAFTLDENFLKEKTILHFGAVDQSAEVFVNGKFAFSHIGGYTSFSGDISSFVTVGENILLVKATDVSDTSYHSRGKQKTNRGGIWYTPQSGIWQTVWLESVEKLYVKNIRFTPIFEENAVILRVFSDFNENCSAVVEGEVYNFKTNEDYKIKLESKNYWSPENPYLYDVEIVLGNDKVKSYFGMRKFSVEKDENGVKRIFLNGKPYFHNGVLDQGYYPVGLYTPVSDEAYINDIMFLKNAGFNMLRKHIKIEPLRFYYHCDRLGLLVWQDMINGGENYNLLTISSPLITGISFKDNLYTLFARKNKEGREEYKRELTEMVNSLYNCVSVCMWVPFNEGWGQFDAKEIVDLILKLDNTRLIDHASGWHDQKIGDFKSLHIYFKPVKFKKDKQGRCVILTEFGGYNYRIKGHAFSEKDFGYKRFKSEESFYTALKNLIHNEIIPAKEKGLSASVYTQLSDVEDELNGLITFDREEQKLPFEKLRDIFEPLCDKI